MNLYGAKLSNQKVQYYALSVFFAALLLTLTVLIL